MFEPMYTVGSKIGSYTVTDFSRELFINSQQNYFMLIYELDNTVWVTLDWINTIGKIH